MRSKRGDVVLVLDEAEWFGARTRFLFIAKEPNDRAGLAEACGHDHRELLRNSEQYLENSKRFELNIGRWAHALGHTTTFARPTFELSCYGARDALLRSAVINVKKTGGFAAARRSGSIAFRETVRCTTSRVP